MRKLVLAAGLVLSGSLLTSCGLLPTEEEFQEAPIVKQYEGESYGKTSVIRGDLTETEELSGTYKGTATYKLLGQGESKVKKVYVKKGSKVLAGDLLVRYYVESYEKKYADTKFSIEKINLQMKQQEELKKLDIAKQKKLGSSKSMINSIKEQYDATISSYQTQLKILKLDLQEAKDGIEESDGMSELDGTVTKVAEGLTGSTPEADTVLITVEGKKKNRFEIKSKYASKYQAGDVVTIEVKGQDYEARIAKPSGKENTMYIYPNNATMKFKSGDKCRLSCVLNGKKNILYLPSTTVYETGGKSVVYIEDEEGIKTMKEVTTGVTINHMTEIISGLNEGDQVITN